MLTRRLPLILSVVAVFALVAVANAAVVISTNMGNGGEAELREEQQSTTYDPVYDADVVVPNAYNRGGSNELATRLGPTQSSVSYIKFDITGLPALGDVFWTNYKNAVLRTTVNNTNLVRNSRLESLRPGATSTSTNSLDWNYVTPGAADSAVQMEFAVYGLDPNGTYANDPGGSGTKTDRSGHTYTSTQSAYEWTEGTGTGQVANADGITFYDAPGITPHCVVLGTCDTAEYGGDAANSLQSRGYIDDFDANVIPLGTWNWPTVNPMNHLAVGSNMDFTSPAILDLVKAAILAGRESVTLIVAHNMDRTMQNVPITTDPDGLPNSFFGFNYLMNPKEKLVLPNDTAWDPDVFNSPPDSQASPFSGASNADGRFSPKLLIIPEPASLLLIGLGLAGLALTCRRK
jgi:hypothetical protein